MPFKLVHVLVLFVNILMKGDAHFMNLLFDYLFCYCIFGVGNSVKSPLIHWLP